MSTHQVTPMDDDLLGDPERARDALQALLDSAGNALLVVSGNGTIIAANAAVDEYFGLLSKELQGTPFDDFASKAAASAEEPSRFLEVLQRVRTAQDVTKRVNAEVLHDLSVRLDRPAPRLVTPYWGPIKNATGAQLGNVCAFADVTEIVRSEQQIRAVADVSPIPLIITRISDGTVLYANDRLAEIVGLSATELVGRKSPDFYWDAADRQRVLDLLAERGEVPGLEIRLRSTSGELRWAIFRLVAARILGESVVLGGLYDITDRKVAEEALRRSEERFRSFVENASDVIFACDLSGTVTYCSPNAQSVLGYSSDAIEGAALTQFVHEADAPDLERLFTSAVRGGTRCEREHRRQLPDTSFRWFEARVSALRDSHGAVIGVTGTLRDIHEHKSALADLERANRELRESRDKLVQSEKMAALGMLVAGIAHEINTPIGAVGSMHDTLIRAVSKLRHVLATELDQDYSEQPKIKQILKFVDDANRVIADGTQRVTTIVKRLKSFARLDEAELQEADLHEGLEDTLTLIHHELKRSVRVHRCYGDLPRIACYPSRLNQVFLNLLMNAKQAIDGDGDVTIKTWASEGHVHISISDSGPGIPEAVLPRIFDPGFTTKGVGVGTGLGLSICYQIVEEHHGDIHVQSRPGQGATFSISIPTNLARPT